MIPKALTWFLLTVWILSKSQVWAQVVIESVNGDKDPIGPYPLWNGSEVGWLYTPGLNYDLNGVFTKFGDTADPRLVKLEIFNGLPSAGSDLLVSSAFPVIPGGLSGAYFDPINFTAGQEYFIGFANVSRLRANIAAIPDATFLSHHYFGDRYATKSDFPSAPILYFTAIPEPPTLCLLALGVPLFCGVWRKARHEDQRIPHKLSLFS